VEQVENKVSGTEDEVKELNKRVKYQERMLRKYDGTCKISGTP
jgi:hypothetical protein